ncbi:MAG: CYTH and CHAD domain-containing protein [Candidatus Dactylopiibacterium sp.]|nr:CYTH and CHAD domain-containing protein [Candidatus Dactylopiibacterium sp.]
MANEIELKLSFPPAARQTVLAHPVFARAALLTHATLTNTYFDTPALALSARRIALRTRRAGEQWLQTVKCAADSLGGLSSRPEWEQPFDGDFDFTGIDAPAVRKQLERLRGELVPLFTTDFERHTYRLRPHEGVEILLMVDHGGIRANDRGEPISEVELELVQGSADDLFALALELAADLPLLPYDPSKAARGYRLFRQQAPAPEGFAPSAPPAAPGLAHFRDTALRLAALWAANLHGALASDDPEYLHQMRVALVRLRHLLRLFAPVLPPHFTGHWQTVLRDETRALAAPRELQVLAALLHGATEGDSDARLTGLIAHAEAAARQAREEAVARLAAPGAGAVLLAFNRALLALPVTHRTPAGFVPDTLAALHAAARRRLKRARKQRTPERLHALRIAIKRLRHACEVLLPDSRATRRDVRRLAREQGRLGRVHDLAVAIPQLADWARAQPALAPAESFVAGWLAATSLKLRRTILRDAAKALARRRWRRP